MDLSFWEKDTYFSHIDVLVIGSGIVGLSAALHLKTLRPELKVVVVERGLLPTGGSSKNAGFACFGSPSELLDDLARHPEEDVFALVARRWRGLQRLRQHLGDKAIGYQQWGGYELFDDPALHQTCLGQLPFLNRQMQAITGLKATYKPADPGIAAFGFRKVQHLLACVAEGQLDTGKMMLALTQKAQAAGVIILNGLNIEQLHYHAQGISAITPGGFAITAKAALVATNGFAKQLLPELAVVPARGQVLVTKPIPGLRLKGAFHYDRGYYYFRNIGNRVLLGGGRNLDFATEETSELGLTSLVQQKLEELLREVILPDTPFEVEHRWSGIMGMGPAKTTVVQQVSGRVVCAVRLAGMGVAIGSLAGEEGAELVLQLL